ncbi:hypothetical protein [Halorubrum sp. Ea1]|uniref:hypothetical protein n=1 Tax=Halorubrum sp. Ea1 TaxID=1480718 RepID=UPI00113FE4C5|nr:hypothetical protein [Halorubrum sp. Ea1]
MTKRRKFLAGLGALATGSAAAMGTGAFSTVSAERTVSIEVTGDANAYLGLEASSQYSKFDNKNRLQVSLNKLNKNARTEITDIFTVRNNGNQDVAIFIDDGSYAFGGQNPAAEKPSKSNFDQTLRDNGIVNDGFYDDDLDTEDINSGDALPSAYRDFDASTGNFSQNPTYRSVFDSNTYDHIISPGNSLSPDYYIDLDKSDVNSLDVEPTINILAFTEEFAEAGKGP